MRSRICAWIANRNDDAAFERVVNTPTRGIGDRRWTWYVRHREIAS